MKNDNPEWQKSDFERAKPMKEVLPEAMEALKRSRGRPPVASPKIHIGMRLDEDIVEWLRSKNGYNALVNDTLRHQMEKDVRGELQ